MKIFILSFGFILILTSCGDLFTKKKKEIVSNQFATCKLDTQALSNIFVQNIKGDIYCLEENLNLFMNVVRSDNPGTLSLKELKIYLTKNIKDIDPDILKAIPAIFDINALLFDDERTYISRANVKKLINFFIALNEESVEKNLYNHFLDDKSISYSEHLKRRHLIYTAAFNLSKVLENALSQSRERKISINIKSFLEYFRTDKNSKDIDDLIDFVFVKRMILGGSKEMLTDEELKSFVTKMSDIAKVLYDVKNFNHIVYKEDELADKLRTYRADIISLENILFAKRGQNESMFTMTDLRKALSQINEDVAYYMKYDELLKKIKDVYLGSNSEVVSSSEIYRLFDHLSYLVEQSEYFHYLFEENRNVLNKGIAVDLTAKLSSESFLTDRQKEYSLNFARITKNYRYYKGESYIPSFTHEVKRTSKGIIEISVYEYLIKLAAMKYGSYKGGEYLLSQDDVNSVLYEYKQILIDEGFVDEAHIKSTGETITLLTTLFQNQSNGDSYMSVPELTEFGMSLLSAFNLASDLRVALRNSQAPECKTYRKNGEVQEVFSTDCFRKEFPSFLSEMTVDDKPVNAFLKKFNSYFHGNDMGVEEQVHFLKKAETFSRQCTVYNDGVEVPMKIGDLFVIFGGLLNLEQTYLRFDKDNSNILTPNELEDAYSIYKTAVEALVPTKILKNQIAKNMYLYLIKYKTVPDIEDVKNFKDFLRAAREGGKFAAFALGFKGPKHVDAKRETIAAILQVLGVMSPEAKANPYDCEALRDRLK